jgi:hypothetical protein
VSRSSALIRRHVWDVSRPGRISDQSSSQKFLIV